MQDGKKIAVIGGLTIGPDGRLRRVRKVMPAIVPATPPGLPTLVVGQRQATEDTRGYRRIRHHKGRRRK